MDLGQTAWLTGFIDGEGCFSLDDRYRPRLSVTLRVDDLGVLERVAEAFGGAVHTRTGRQADRRGNNPAAVWTVTGKGSLATLVRYFDAYLLQSKKARDYAIWRRAVSVYCARGYKDPELPILKAALVAARSFEAAAPGEIPAPAQLRLAEGT